MLKTCLYGPVTSWRLGKSIGVDLLSDIKKICNFDCVYCQIGKTDILINEYDRKIFVPNDKIFKEIESLGKDLDVDVFTFAGRGEPTLAKNLYDVVNFIKSIRKEKLVIITNSMNLYIDEVQKSLENFDIVMAKFDAFDDSMMCKINRPINKINPFEKLYNGLLNFGRDYKGSLELQIMFLDNNKSRDVYKNAFEFLKNIGPDKIYINTPIRPCDVHALTFEEIQNIKNDFCFYFQKHNILSRKNKNIEIISVYDRYKNVKLG